jgi:hypothetical protein
MAKSIIASTKKRGRPHTTGKGAQVNMRWHEEALTAIDKWAKRNDCSRSEAIRRLVELGLKARSAK